MIIIAVHAHSNQIISLRSSYFKMHFAVPWGRVSAAYTPIPSKLTEDGEK